MDKLTESDKNFLARILVLGSGEHCPKDMWQAKHLIGKIIGQDPNTFVAPKESLGTYLFNTAICLECGEIIHFHTSLPVDYVFGCGSCQPRNIIPSERYLRMTFPGYFITALKTYLTTSDYYAVYYKVLDYLLDKKGKL